METEHEEGRVLGGPQLGMLSESPPSKASGTDLGQLEGNCNSRMPDVTYRLATLAPSKVRTNL